jgi:hypothetical protein
MPLCFMCSPFRSINPSNSIFVGCILLRYVYIYLSNIYLRSQLRIHWCYFYSICSQHVSVLMGHLQVKYNYITYIS